MPLGLPAQAEEIPMKPSSSAAVLSLLVSLAVAPAALAQAPPPPATEVGLSGLVLTQVPAKGGAKLTVSTPAFRPGADIPFANTQYQGNVFPGLTWSAGPAGTRSYAIVMQDTDAVRNGEPILHWTMYNIPASVRTLAPGMTAPPPGASNGPNIRGPNMAYMGPRTPPGPKHRYHLQVYALDTTLTADPAMTFDALKAALKGHVRASGEVVGLGQADPHAPPPAPPPGAPRPPT
jgi:para-nitrobenzyl esterase